MTTASFAFAFFSTPFSSAFKTTRKWKGVQSCLCRQTTTTTTACTYLHFYFLQPSGSYDKFYYFLNFNESFLYSETSVYSSQKAQKLSLLYIVLIYTQEDHQIELKNYRIQPNKMAFICLQRRKIKDTKITCNNRHPGSIL